MERETARLLEKLMLLIVLIIAIYFGSGIGVGIVGFLLLVSW